MTPIFVTTGWDRVRWLTDATESIGPRPHVILVEPTFELGKMQWIMDHTTFDRWVFLQDSVVITDPTIFDVIDETPGSICLHHMGGMHFSCYLGVFERKIIEKIGIPLVTSKEESVSYESRWALDYREHTDMIACFDPEHGYGPMVLRHGRQNLTYDTGYLVKYRGDWGQR